MHTHTYTIRVCVMLFVIEDESLFASYIMTTCEEHKAYLMINTKYNNNTVTLTFTATVHCVGVVHCCPNKAIKI